MTTMSRQHFELISHILREYKEMTGSKSADPHYTAICQLFADHLQYTNNEFDTDRFIEQCDIWTTTGRVKAALGITR